MTTPGSPDFVPVPERIALFDNDGTLWCEQPAPVQLYFVVDRVKALARQHPEWKTTEPFASLLKGDIKSALAGGERALVVGATISSWVAMALLVDAVLFICPLLVFTDKLWASRTAGLARYQSLAARYATEFEARWTDGTVHEGAPPLLGTSDIQSMADLDHTVKGVKEMRWITVGERMLTMMTVAGIGPFLPLLLLKYPIADLAQKFLSKLIGL